MSYFINFVLELLWNITAKQNVRYKVFPHGNTLTTLKPVDTKEGPKDFVFISKQIVYRRKKFGLNRTSRVYRVEVVGPSRPTTESKIYHIPELCSWIFKNTNVPHVIAINCIIQRFIKEKQDE